MEFSGGESSSESSSQSESHSSISSQNQSSISQMKDFNQEIKMSPMPSAKFEKYTHLTSADVSEIKILLRKYNAAFMANVLQIAMGLEEENLA